MATRHVVYRCELDHQVRWRGYATYDGEIPVHVRAPSLGQAQQLMAATTVGDGNRSGWVEHTEHAAGDGLWVREALDEQVLEREHTTRVLMEVLTDQRLRARLATLPACRVGGVPVVVCVPGDAVEWVVGQHDGHGALIVTAAVTNHQVWWNVLVPADRAAETDLGMVGNLAELGLTGPEATLDDWMAATDTAGLVLFAPQHAKAATLHRDVAAADPSTDRCAGAPERHAQLLGELEATADPLRAAVVTHVNARAERGHPAAGAPPVCAGLGRTRPAYPR
ncbi:hypothetical protein SAMN05216215_11134 [Saccharopolyspora shandongensis]|uniref:Uncharacterized protein n=1 Tax=Saccharopolyspora shandongensis TaxID=418495 RepID=A0A1H3U8W1_9PSEU|nr:hypothetical protein [Saccharopolyspora shandongensis]SDZ58009.1 hypothetical protein SAMN05216215_11134 [Saccharopolyspora shandongensis]